MHDIQYIIHHAGPGLPPVGSTGSAFTFSTFARGASYHIGKFADSRVFFSGIASAAQLRLRSKSI